MIVTCNRCGHLCRPSIIDGYDYKCLHCHEDKYLCAVTEYTDALLEEVYIDWFNNFLTSSTMSSLYRLPCRILRLIINHGRIVHLNKHKMEE